MRTPGNDYELAVGFCVTDGLLAGAPVTGVRYCADGSAVDSQFNVVTVETGGRAPAPTPRLGTDVVQLRLVRERPARRPPRPSAAAAAVRRRSTRPSWPRCRARVLDGQGLFDPDRRRPRRRRLRPRRHGAADPRGRRPSQRRRQGRRRAGARGRAAGDRASGSSSAAGRRWRWCRRRGRPASGRWSRSARRPRSPSGPLAPRA